MDWAETAAGRLLDLNLGEGMRFRALAAALRAAEKRGESAAEKRGRIAGLREAAAVAVSGDPMSGNGYDPAISNHINSLADKLEQSP